MTLDEIRSRYRNQLVAAAEGRSLLDLTGLWLDLEAVLGCKFDVVSSRGL